MTDVGKIRWSGRGRWAHEFVWTFALHETVVSSTASTPADDECDLMLASMALEGNQGAMILTGECRDEIELGVWTAIYEHFEA